MHEKRYISEVPISHRKQYGQFFTPPAVAHIMVQWVLKNNPKTILDPAFGLGVFYDAIMSINSNKLLKFVGYEIDDNIFEYLNYDEANLKIFNSDYLEANLSSFDGIICNPPYMRFQRFPKRHDILPAIEKQIGKKLVGYSNIASIFLVKALKELNFNGNLSFIMPFEFFNTGYGEEIKRSLLENHLLKQIIIFSNEKEIFPEAITTVCVLLCNYNAKQDPIKITKIKTIDEVNEISDSSDFYHQKIRSSELPYNKKWTPIILSLFSEQIIPDDFCKLSLYGSFTRGIATGANSFFSLTKSDIESMGIDINNRCKCITKSQQIKKPVFTEDDFHLLYNTGKPVYCFDVSSPQKREIYDYIKQGEKLRYHERYLTSKRYPWYKIEHRKPAQILFGVFNRGRLKVVRNFTNAINFTCFHSFYPNIFGKQLLNKLFVYLLSNIGQDIIRINKRSYGNNLDKFEPGDINSSLCPNPYQLEMIDNEEAINVVEIAKTDEELAIQICDDLIKEIMSTPKSSSIKNSRVVAYSDI
jgi:adenine-specific DNA-methyltransferase